MTKNCLRFCFFSLSVMFLMTLGLPAQARSESTNSGSTSQDRIVFQETFSPPGDDQPDDSSGAGSRDGLKCNQDQQPIRPIMPRRNYGLTLKERPSIFIYLPNTSARQMVLTFQDQTGNFYERAFLPIPARVGIVSITLPDDKLPLTVGKNYQWSLAIICGETIQPDDPVFKGWVQRVARSLEIDRELESKSTIEQAAWYGAKGYWYDMLETMVQELRSHPNDAHVNALWRDLLESVGLNAIASEPLIVDNQ